jgi:hypothetical protein
MPSVKATGTSIFVGRTGGFPATFTFGVWLRINSYSTNFTQGILWANNLGGGGGGGVDTDESGSSTTLDAYVFKGATEDFVSILTGSYTNWVFVALTHTSGSNNFDVYWRNQEQAYLNHHTLNCGADLDLNAGLSVAGGSGEVSATNARNFFLKNSVLTATQILASSMSMGAPSGSNETYLVLSSATGAGTNGGTGGNWTVTGALATDSTAGSQPEPDLPSALLMGSGSTS